MKSKERIRTLIKILEDSNINSMEVSSFWGFTKIKLSKDQKTVSSITSISDNSMHKEAPVSIPDTNQKGRSEKNQDVAIDDTHTAEVEKQDLGYVQKAPLVGTVYLSPKPDEENFINEGDRVKKGQVICIIEAMKIFNEIESEQDGTIKTVYLKNEDPVEFGQPLIEILPD